MVMSYNRSAKTFKKRDKPIGSVLKIWDLCDSGYVSYAFSHSNGHPWRRFGAYKLRMSHSSGVAARLCKEVYGRFQEQTKKSKYSFYMDNIFFSGKLFVLHWDRDIGAAGTVRANSASFPKKTSIKKKAQTSNELEFDWVYCMCVREGTFANMDWQWSHLNAFYRS